MFCKKNVIPKGIIKIFWWLTKRLEKLKKISNKGTKYGPFPGKIIYPSELAHTQDDSSMWEIFVEGRLSHFIDGRIPCNQKSNSSSDYISQVNNWMTYINSARFAQEQNMIAVQSQGEIFYEVCKDICQVSKYIFLVKIIYLWIIMF